MTSDSNEHLRNALLDHLLVAPNVNLLKRAATAAELVDGISLDDLEMTNDETGENNHREVRSVDRDLDKAKSEVKDFESEVRYTILSAPFERAVTLAHSSDMAFDEWEPERWLMAFAEGAPAHYDEAVRAVVYNARPDEALPWFQAINAQAPHPGLLGDLWRTALSAPGEREPNVVNLVGGLVEAFLNDDTVPEPLNACAQDDSSSLRDVKLNALHKAAFDAYYGQNSSALRQYMWQHHGLGPTGPQWDKVVDRMVAELARHNREQREYRFDPLPENAYTSVTTWMTRLTNTGHLDDWLRRPEQWTTVSPPMAGTGGYLPPTRVLAWMKDHVTQGTFTWSVLVAGMEALNQPGLAQEFKRLGERWSLAHEAQQMAPENAPVERERARL